MDEKKAQILALLVMVALCLGLLQGCGPGGKGSGVMRVTAPEAAFPSDKPSQGGVFRMKSGDVLGFVFLQNPELNTEQTVRPDGKVTLKLIGDVVAAGLTPMELEEQALRMYADFVANSRYTLVLKPGDYFELRHVYNPELNIGVRIRSDGKISLPMVGEVQAAGLTPEELRKNLIRKYSKDITRPDIALLVGENTTKQIYTAHNTLSVSVNKAAGHRVFVVGEVKNPRAVPADMKITLMQAISDAGGVNDNGDLSRVVVLRRTEENKMQWLQADLLSQLEGIDMRNDVWVHAGDIVVVPKTGIAKLNQFVRQYVRDLIPIQTQFVLTEGPFLGY
ncbi:MAG: polysaccharide biosynthesis/export family protein [Desulfobacteraceae bacterium]|nr:polysaccharide biosynthesis/export family protein [Desulfobacteraceae bacterium]